RSLMIIDDPMKPNTRSITTGPAPILSRRPVIQSPNRVKIASIAEYSPHTDRVIAMDLGRSTNATGQPSLSGRQVGIRPSPHPAGHKNADNRPRLSALISDYAHSRAPLRHA